MADQLARRILAARARHDRQQLAADAELMARHARQFADDTAAGRLTTAAGDASRLAQEALQLAAAAARLGGWTDAAEVVEGGEPS
ncbi:hypothetical protein [Streptomyces phytophilus]|uniref:hypothetical protein n=1 Tax=Streptomyces phytophilus TaxID=722715 RepID=UPI0015F0B047|nr:hypothetical protein [Streptomyces phytophilus]